MTTLSELTEAVKKKVVYRNGKRLKKKVSTKDGYKMVGGKEVRMKQKEKKNRKISQRKGAKKRKASKSKANRKRKFTLRKKKP